MTLAALAIVSSLAADATLVSSGEWWLVDQTRTYCGRNENEPLTRVLFNTQNWTSFSQTEYPKMISDDNYYAVGFRLYFNAMNDEQLVTKLKAYVKVYPQNVAVMGTDGNVSYTSGNPLRGNQGEGTIGGGCGIEDAIDL